uniref:Uncharacterized protein n=1 Tax=Pyxicephalus adspersus TaxID=30357 RepID=A0AAV3A221_PYXAD|nr:TPA: hypothetical protein GDO54_003583 [Pyxicephalus adspersus]
MNTNVACRLIKITHLVFKKEQIKIATPIRWRMEKYEFYSLNCFLTQALFACVITGVHIYMSLGPLKQAFDFSDESMHETVLQLVVHDLQFPHMV